MWKRDQQILDVYGVNSLPGSQHQQSKDDSLIVPTKSLYRLPFLSHSQPSLETYTRNINSSRVYQGNEFDVFKKEPTLVLEITDEKESALPQEDTKSMKRTSISYLIDKEDVSNKKKRRMEPSTSGGVVVVDKEGIFIKSTAPANTPANIFMAHTEAEQNSYDLEYN